ncbi:alpha-glucosidase/alpha-galactosidase [Streptomyces monomycini]|uniref:alpha-glucosidase/alpha-galactosidase n=1 Tax=Streptomyces monomycini TaxID=371720 RepID=UPI000995F018|nr:alpha-glucosidase/alpha-galactosidase [Streptomyces monomycini]
MTSTAPTGSTAPISTAPIGSTAPTSTAPTGSTIPTSSTAPRTIKIAFIGAGSVVFTQGLLADLLAFPELRRVHVALHDIDPERLATAEGAAHHIAAARGAEPVVTAHLDRRAALEGADFVINTVQVGMDEATRLDFRIPARYGLRQTIGDTLGVGGIFRALRTFPLLRALAEDMAGLCPDAWLLNYTNPMAMNVMYLTQATPLRRVVGLCHSVYWTVHDLAELLGVPYEEVSYLAAGVNHQAWVLRFERHGQDLYPLLDDVIAKDPQLLRRVRVDMYRRLGHYPTETSEHSSEYVPWYLHHDSEVERLRLPIGTYLDIIKENAAEYERTRDALAAGAPLPVEGTMEYAPQIIHSIVSGTPRTVYGNVPNQGLIDNLPGTAVVEVPCLVDSLGVQPTRVGALPPQCAALNRACVSANELVVRAAVDGDPRHIRHAAMADPATAAALPVERIWDLCDDLVRAHADLLQPELREVLGH